MRPIWDLRVHCCRKTIGVAHNLDLGNFQNLADFRVPAGFRLAPFSLKFIETSVSSVAPCRKFQKPAKFPAKIANKKG